MKKDNELYELLQKQVENYIPGTSLFRTYDRTGRPAFFGAEQFWQDYKRSIQMWRSVPEKRLAIWGYNSYEWVVTALAALTAGKHLILMDPNLPVPEAKELYRNMDAEGMLADTELVAEAAEHFAGETVCDFEDVLLNGLGEAKTGGDGSTGYAGEPAGCAERGKDEEAEQMTPGDFICFTSGTSQHAKGVVISSHTLCTCVKRMRGLLLGAPGDRYYLPLPFHHIYGFTMLLHILEAGGTICLHQGARYIQKNMMDTEPKYAFFVPSMLGFLLEQKRFPESLSAVYTGGGFCKPEYEGKAENYGIKLINLYGLSETLGAICSSTAEKNCAWLRPFGGVAFSLSEQGEIVAELPFHMDGYYRNPDKTAEILHGDTFYTGDAGEMNADGCIRVCGRLRDTLVLENGEKIYAEDVDLELDGLRGASETAAFVYDGRLMAAAVLDGSVPEACYRADWNQWNQMRMRSQKLARLWIRDAALPRTATGKIKRAELEKQYRNWLEAQSNGKEGKENA